MGTVSAVQYLNGGNGAVARDRGRNLFKSGNCSFKIQPQLVEARKTVFRDSAVPDTDGGRAAYRFSLVIAGRLVYRLLFVPGR